MKLSISRIVHYVLPSGGHRPAIVVDMAGNNPHLVVWLRADDSDPDTGGPLTNGKLSVYRDHVQEDPTGNRGGSWHWPEREA